MPEDFKKKTDEQLYDLLSGNKDLARIAFDELYYRYSTKIFTYCRKVLNNLDIAEDIFQETFTRFYESSRTERKMTNVAGFIIKIARNLCLNEKSKRLHDKVQNKFTHISYIETSFERQELSELIDRALESLPETYREALVLKEFLDMSYKEIAEILGSTLPIIRIRIYRAKNKLREFLTPYLKDLQS